MTEENKDANFGSPNSEVFAHGQRMKAVTVMRERAKRLQSQAAHWNALADSLEAIERYAKKECVDGSEAGPHIGVGSKAEILLWELANKDWPG
jgi:hypothetical protein